MKVGAVVLAAGASSRLGEPKQLLRDQSGESLVHRIARDAIAAGATPVIVVVGAVVDEIKTLLDDLDVFVAHNADWATGLSSSIRAGVAAAAEHDVDAVLLLTCDMPSVGVAHLETMNAELSNGAMRVASSYGDTLGVPAIVRRAEFSELLQLSGDRGAKSLLMQGGTVTVQLAGGTFDLDTPADVAAWRARVE